MGSLRGSPTPSIYGDNTTVVGGGGIYTPPKGLLMAISEIQNYYVIETSGKNIPTDFFSVAQVRDFFRTGSRTGFVEIFFTFIFFPLFGFLMPSYLKFFFGALSAGNFIFYWVLAFAPILGFLPLCVYMSRFYAGLITKKAITSLLSGRAASIVFSGFFSAAFYLFLYSMSGDIKTGHYFVNAAYALHALNRNLPHLRAYYSLWFYAHCRGKFIDIAVSFIVVHGLSAALPVMVFYVKYFKQKWKRAHVEAVLSGKIKQ